MNISEEALGKAIEYVRSHARRVDSLALASYLGRGDRTDLLDALSAYQNHDGGFGHAIEPDFRVPDSSVTATTVAFQYLIAHDAPSQSEVVRKGIEYLVSSFNKESGSWPPVCPEIAGFPRANWWEYFPPITFKPDDPNWANPNIEAIGILSTYAELIEPAFLASLNEQAAAWLDANETAEAHALLCAMRYGESLQGDHHRHTQDRLAKIVSNVVTTDPAEWAKYSPQPVWYARRPDALLADAFGDTLGQNIDFVISQQSSDGSWQPTWDWGRYPDVWPDAKAEWAGYLTAVNIRMLIDFGRCDASNVDSLLIG